MVSRRLNNAQTVSDGSEMIKMQWAELFDVMRYLPTAVCGALVLAFNFAVGGALDLMRQSLTVVGGVEVCFINV